MEKERGEKSERRERGGGGREDEGGRVERERKGTST